MANSEDGQCSGEEAGSQNLCWRVAPGSSSQVEWVPHWGRLGASGLLSGVGVVQGGKWVTEVLRGFSSCRPGDPLPGGPHWEDPEGWSWEDFVEFSGSPNEQTMSNTRRAGPLAS